MYIVEFENNRCRNTGRRSFVGICHMTGDTLVDHPKHARKFATLVAAERYCNSRNREDGWGVGARFFVITEEEVMNFRQPEWWTLRADFQEEIVADANMLGGVPTLSDTRVSLSQVIAEIAESDLLSSVCDDLSLSAEQVKVVLLALSQARIQPPVSLTGAIDER